MTTDRTENNTNNRRPRHVLHAVGTLDVGGAEVWLLEVARSIDRSEWQFDFLVNRENECDLSSEFRKLGCRIFSSPRPSQFGAYRRNLLHVLRDRGPYDVIHSHVHPGAFPLLWAKREGVPARIVHTHGSLPLPSWFTHPIQRFLTERNRSWICQCANGVLSTSEAAGKILLGREWQTTENAKVHYCGIDLNPFRQTVDKVALRCDLGIENSSLVMGHVGRFSADGGKNHTRMLQVLKAVLAKEPKACLLLVGDGPGRAGIEQQANEMELAKHVHFLGTRRDVPALMLAAMDVFLFPSLYEGLGLALVEAQAAGLPSIVASTVPTEVDVNPKLLTRLSLDESASVWADAVLAAHRSKSRLNAEESLKLIAESPFNIEVSARGLTEYYQRVLDDLPAT